MPEAAEVEIVREGLEQTILIANGHPRQATLNRIEIFDNKLDQGYDYLNWNKQIKAFRRHGKLLGIEFDDGTMLALHLRLAGRLVVGPDPKPRAVMHFSAGDQVGIISFADPRRFATMKVIDASDFGLGSGPDLLHGNLDLWEPPDSARAAKTVFLDQKQIAGIGNYLIDEALWENEILPSRKFNTLSESEIKEVAYSARSIAREALRHGGMSVRDYVNVAGETGDFHDSLKCYGRAGKPCLRCGKDLSKTKVGSRGTTYCSFCQI